MNDKDFYLVAAMNPTLPTTPQVETEPVYLAPARKYKPQIHPVSSFLGGLLGLLIVVGAVTVAWVSSRDASRSSALPPELNSVVIKRQETEPAKPRSSSLLGTARPALQMPGMPTKITLQEAAMLDVERLSQPAGDIYTAKPLKEVPFQVSPLWADDAVFAEAKQVMQYYLSAPQPEAKAQFTLKSHHVLERMKSFYEVQGNEDPVLGELKSGLLITAGEVRIIQLDYASASRSGGKVSAFFHRTKGGGLLLDWESFVGFSETGWAEYRETKPQTPVWLRAVADAGDYYNFDFADAAHFLCVRLTSPDGKYRMNGYLPRGTAIAQMLLQRLKYDELNLTGRRTASMLVTVKTTFPFPAQSDQCVNIRDVITDRWLMFDWEANVNP